MLPEMNNKDREMRKFKKADPVAELGRRASGASSPGGNMQQAANSGKQIL
jgi:hypothetical protein